MLAIKVNGKYAEHVKMYLKKHAMLDIKHRVISSNSFIYFPICKQNGNYSGILAGLKKFDAVAVEKKFGSADRKPSYREILRKNLGRDYADATRGFEILGSIAIIEAEPRFARRVAAAVMESNKNIKTVLRKSGAVEGRYRTRKYAYVSGAKKYVAEYRENGAVLRFDVRKSFFSGKLSFERARLAAMSKGREHVLVMFAGVGPFAIELAKTNKDADVVAIELNRNAYEAMAENIKFNRTPNVRAVLGDVRTKAREYSNFADRIIMPLPKDSHSFLGEVFACARKKCIVHYYAFVEVEGGSDKCVGDLKKFFEAKNCGFKLLGTRTVRPYSPAIIEIVVDFAITKKHGTSL